MPDETPKHKTARAAGRAKEERRASASQPEEERRPRLRIRIRAYDNKIIDQSARQIVDTAERIGVEVVGPVPLPAEIRKYTVNSATFKYKNARDQYEMRVHKRLIDIVNPTPKVIDSLTNLTLPVGVDIEIKML